MPHPAGVCVCACVCASVCACVCTRVCVNVSMRVVCQGPTHRAMWVDVDEAQNRLAER